MLKFLKKKLVNKKGGSFFLLPFFMFVISCKSFDLNKYGRITLHNSDNKNSFIFSIADEFTRSTAKSPVDKENPKMNQAEAKLLIALLKQQKYCLNNYGKPLFTIISRQEKVYDMTFAHLIEQSYNARAVSPRMYFGECVKEK